MYVYRTGERKQRLCMYSKERGNGYVCMRKKEATAMYVYVYIRYGRKKEATACPSKGESMMYDV